MVQPVVAAEFTVRPFLIDEVVEPRGLITKNITLTNDTGHQLTIYASVNEIALDSNGEIKEFVTPVMTDRTNTVTSWIEITRGRTELMPGETKEVPVTFRIHPNPEPGEYQAFIGFANVTKKHEAQQKTLAGDAQGVIVKLTVEDSSEEFLRVSAFLVDRFIARENQRTFEVKVQNMGDTTEIPGGEVIFFNSTGEEVGAVQLNEAGVKIGPGETQILTADVPFYNKLGRYKANLSLQYGEKQRAFVHDSVQFFMMPYHMMLALLAAMMLVGLVIALLLRNMFKEYQEDAEGTELPFYVREGHEPNPKDHDIDLSKKD